MAQATASLNIEGKAFANSKDSILVIRFLGDLPGGRTLDVTGFTGSVIYAGHLIMKKEDGTLYPHPVEGEAYKSEGKFTPSEPNDKVVGLLKSTILTSNPQASILTIGQVREAALPFPISDEIKAKMPHIQFI